MSSEFLQNIRRYHQLTKHDLGRYAPGPGYLDWATQPDPFRRYPGAPLIFLPPLISDDSLPYHRIVSGDLPEPAPLNAVSLSRFFELSLAISAWKQAGDSRWALRVNPSSGNLHPTEGYLVTGEIDDPDLEQGVFHYAAKEHALERRCTWESPLPIFGHLPEPSFLVGLTSIHWREAWKYGDRAFRYCQHDLGHAVAALAVSAAVQGWQLQILDAMADDHIRTLLGLDRDEDFREGEREHPDLMVVVFPADRKAETRGISEDDLAVVEKSEWTGQANRLSPDHRHWPGIELAAESSVHPESSPETTPHSFSNSPVFHSLTHRQEWITAGQIIRQRRSAVAFDGVTGMEREEFFTALGHTLGRLPFDCLPWKPAIHLALFVHRVRGLPAGLYFLLRDADQLPVMRDSMKSSFAWEKPEGCPEELPLFCLEQANLQTLAAQVSCTQEIAGQSAFSLGMIADYDRSLDRFGSWFYPRLFWEAGMVGHMLYLAAEFLHLRATGIGCYFDDPVHQILGLSGTRWQSLYHFTVGGSVEDKRLSTLSAYPWSCDFPGGRFLNRPASAEEVVLKERTDTLPKTATVEWQGKTLTQVGLGARSLTSAKRLHRMTVEAFTGKALNVVETAPGQTGGGDEILIGDTLNSISEMRPDAAKGIFFISRIGLMQGNLVWTAEALKQRGRAFPEMTSLREGISHCLHPLFLEDQMERSRRRLGIGHHDLVLLDLPEELTQALSPQELKIRLRRAAEFLEDRVQQGTLGAFGISSAMIAHESTHPASLPFEFLNEVMEGLQGFGAVAFPASFLNSAPFESQSRGPGWVRQAREAGLLILAGRPLHGMHAGKELTLLDFPESRKEAEGWDWVLNELDSWEKEVHGAPMRDGRTLKELLDQAAIPSPFTIRKWVEPARNFHPQTLEAGRQTLANIDQLYTRAQGLAEQLAQARLWDPEHLNACLESLEAYLDWVSNSITVRNQQINREEIQALRVKYFPDADPRESLQSLGFRWLWQQGVDVILTGMSRPAHLETAIGLLF